MPMKVDMTDLRRSYAGWAAGHRHRRGQAVTEPAADYDAPEHRAQRIEVLERVEREAAHLGSVSGGAIAEAVGRERVRHS